LARRFLDKNHIEFYLLEHLYQPIEFTILALLYREQLQSAIFKKIIPWLVGLFWLMALLFMFFIEGTDEQSTATFLTESIIIIVFAVRYTYELYFFPPEDESLLRIPFFWINTGHLFYCAGTFFQMGFDTYLSIHFPKLQENLSHISHILNYTLYLLYLTGFLCNMYNRTKGTKYS
jgi:hypothetical protein